MEKEKEMTIVTWPDSQYLFGCANYREHSKLINGEIGVKIYGSSAYLVEKEWWEKDIEQNDDDEDLDICYDDELLRLGFLDEDDFNNEEDDDFYDGDLRDYDD
jgi:hypothetical protein